MKKKVNLRLVTGDPNLVTMDEIYVEFSEDGAIKALKKRNDSGELTTIVDEHVDQYELEDNKGATADLASLSAGDTLEVTPTEGKDGMKKVTVTFSDSDATAGTGGE